MNGVGGVSRERGMGMGKSRFSVVEVGRDGREKRVDVQPGRRRTARFCTLCVICEPLSMRDTITDEGHRPEL